jgi:hypothetical protein
MLNRRRVEFVGDPIQKGFARVSVIAEHADLDQAVRKQIHVDLMQDGRGESIIADHDDRVEVMGLGAERAPFRRWQFKFHPPSIVPFAETLRVAGIG